MYVLLLTRVQCFLSPLFSSLDYIPRIPLAKATIVVRNNFELFLWDLQYLYFYEKSFRQRPADRKPNPVFGL